MATVSRSVSMRFQRNRPEAEMPAAYPFTMGGSQSPSWSAAEPAFHLEAVAHLQPEQSDRQSKRQRCKRQRSPHLANRRWSLRCYRLILLVLSEDRTEGFL